MVASKEVAELFDGPPGKSDLPSFLQGGRVLVGLELGVIVWELVEEDGYGQTVEDDSEGDADKGEDSAQCGLRVDVSVAHGGDADLQGETQTPTTVFFTRIHHLEIQIHVGKKDCHKRNSRTTSASPKIQLKKTPQNTL